MINSDIQYANIDINKEGVYSPLRHHRLGLTETATGYGSKLRTPYVVRYEGRTRRVYAICYGNAASMYIVVNKRQLFIHC